MNSPHANASEHRLGSITIADIDREIAEGARRLVFPAPIETAFEAQTAAKRVRIFVSSATVALCLYDVFLINDFLAVPDVFPALAAARLGIFTPIVAFLIWSLSRNESSVWRESAAAAASILAVLLPMTIMVFSQSQHLISYQFGTLLTMMFAAVVQRIRFRFAVGTMVAIVTIQGVTTWFSHAFDGGAYAPNLIIFVTAGVLLMMAAYFAERGERRSFLFSFRGRLLQAELTRLAQTDALTGLFNRRHLAQVGQAIWLDAAEGPRAVSAALLDIDHFKAFNDSQGHMEGDSCLTRVSACAVGAIAATDGIAVRFGGEEILVLLPGLDEGRALEAARAIRLAIRAAAIPHPALGPGAIVTASVGVATITAPDSSLDALIAAADAALYAAKRAGRDRVVASEGAAPPAFSAAA